MSYFSEIWVRVKKELRFSLKIIIYLKGCSVSLKRSLKKVLIVLLILLEKRNRLKKKKNLRMTFFYKSLIISRPKTQFLSHLTNLLGRTSNVFPTSSTPNTCNKQTAKDPNQRMKSTMMNTLRREGDFLKNKKWPMIIKWESGQWKTWKFNWRTRHLLRCWQAILFRSLFP